MDEHSAHCPRWHFVFFRAEQSREREREEKEKELLSIVQAGKKEQSPPKVPASKSAWDKLFSLSLIKEEHYVH